MNSNPKLKGLYQLIIELHTSVQWENTNQRRYLFSKRQKAQDTKCLTFEQLAPLLGEGDIPYLLFCKAPFPFSESVMQSEFSSTFLQKLSKQNYFPAKLYRNFFLKHAYRLSETELLKANTKHKRKSDFFSASYSGESLLLGISKEKIGVDLEIIKPRDKSLLNTYKAELGTYFWIADWNHFYLLRTAKEAILKASDSENLDVIHKISLNSAEKKIQKIWDKTFGRELIFSFQKKTWKVRSFEDWEKAYSITLFA